MADIRIPPGTRTRDVWELIARAAGSNELDIAERAAPSLRMSVADVSGREGTSSRLVPAAVARAHGVLPLRDSNRTIVVATPDPMDHTAEQALAFASGRAVKFELAGPETIERGLEAAYPSGGAVEDMTPGASTFFRSPGAAAGRSHLFTLPRRP